MSADRWCAAAAATTTTGGGDAAGSSTSQDPDASTPTKQCTQQPQEGEASPQQDAGDTLGSPETRRQQQQQRVADWSNTFDGFRRAVGARLEVALSLKWGTNLPASDPASWSETTSTFHPRHVPPITSVTHGPRLHQDDSINQAYFNRRRRAAPNSTSAARLNRMVCSRNAAGADYININDNGHVVDAVTGRLLVPMQAYSRTLPSDLFAALQSFALTPEYCNRILFRRFAEAWDATIPPASQTGLVRRARWYSEVRSRAAQRVASGRQPAEGLEALRGLVTGSYATETDALLAEGNVEFRYDVATSNPTRLVDCNVSSVTGFDARRLQVRASGVVTPFRTTDVIGMVTAAGFKLDSNDPLTQDLAQLRRRQALPERLAALDPEVCQLLNTPIECCGPAMRLMFDPKKDGPSDAPGQPPASSTTFDEMLQHMGLFIDAEVRLFNRPPMVLGVRSTGTKRLREAKIPAVASLRPSMPEGVSLGARPKEAPREEAASDELDDEEGSETRPIVERELLQRVLRATHISVESERRAALLKAAHAVQESSHSSFQRLLFPTSDDELKFEIVRTTYVTPAAGVRLEFSLGTVWTVDMKTATYTSRASGNEVTMKFTSAPSTAVSEKGGGVREKILSGLYHLLDFLQAFYQMRPSEVAATRASFLLQEGYLRELTNERDNQRSDALMDIKGYRDHRRHTLGFPPLPPAGLNVTAYRPPWLVPQVYPTRATLSPVPQPLRSISSKKLLSMPSYHAMSMAHRKTLLASFFVSRTAWELAVRWTGPPGMGFRSQHAAWIKAGLSTVFTMTGYKRENIRCLDVLHPSGATSHAQLLLAASLGALDLKNRHHMRSPARSAFYSPLGIGYGQNWAEFFDRPVTALLELPILPEDRSKGPSWLRNSVAEGHQIPVSDMDFDPAMNERRCLTFVRVAPSSWRKMSFAHDLARLPCRALYGCCIGAAAKHALYRIFRAQVDAHPEIDARCIVPLMFEDGNVCVAAVRTLEESRCSPRHFPEDIYYKMHTGYESYVPRCSHHDAVPMTVPGSGATELRTADGTLVAHQFGPDIIRLPEFATLDVGTPLFRYGLFHSLVLPTDLWMPGRRWGDPLVRLLSFAH